MFGLETATVRGEGRRGSRTGESRALSYADLTIRRLDAVAAAVGFASEKRAEVRALVAELLAPWGEELIGAQPAAPSDISDDHMPVELSLALTGGMPELRVLFEAQGADASMQARWLAGQAVNGKIQRRLGIAFDRLCAVEDLFIPTAPGARYAMWHALCFHPTRAPALKIYLNPQAQGRENASAVVREAVRRLGFHQAAEAVAE